MATLYVESDDKNKVKALELYLQALGVPYQKKTIRKPKTPKEPTTPPTKKASKK